MRRSFSYILVLCIVSLLWTGCRRDVVQSERLRQLDSALSKKKDYDKRKESGISDLRKEYFACGNGVESYALAKRLYEQYQAYQFDSASSYASRMRYWAQKNGDSVSIAQSDMAQVFCLISSGFFKEAFDEIDRIDEKILTGENRAEYLKLCIRLYYDAANFNDKQPYHDTYLRIGHHYSDALLALLPEDSAYWHYYQANKYMKASDFSRSIAEFEPLVSDDRISIHDKAIVTSCLSWMYRVLGEDEKAIDYAATAAIYDIRGSIKETTALRMLADLLSREGEIDRPARYARASLEDATFYQARMRMLETGVVLPIVEQNRFDDITRQRNTLLVAVALVVLFIAVVVGVLVFVKEKNRKLREARQIIEQRNRELEKSNALLLEANSIKTEYIGTSFYINASFIEKMSEFNKMVERMLSTHQYELLRRSLKESAISETRDRMFESFDHTFLKIFPSFINDYNALFKEPEDWAQDGRLTTEMRIFALIRLGITETDKIAMFLDYSPHTINTYKTRVKNRSWVENDKFESEIMKIGTVSST